MTDNTTFAKRTNRPSSEEHVETGLFNSTKTHGLRPIGIHVVRGTATYTDSESYGFGYRTEFRGTKLTAKLELTVSGVSWGPGVVYKEFDDSAAGEAERERFIVKKIAEMTKRQAKKIA